jgi:hypothetical protein
VAHARLDELWAAAMGARHGAPAPVADLYKELDEAEELARAEFVAHVEHISRTFVTVRDIERLIAPDTERLMAAFWASQLRSWARCCRPAEPAAARVFGGRVKRLHRMKGLVRRCTLNPAQSERRGFQALHAVAPADRRNVKWIAGLRRLYDEVVPTV